MCSKGVSVWFACKLCKSFFLNADDFAYHKKKSHLEEFQNTKFIVFEEQTTPPESPPENWVSFVSPKEETLIHKIISSPLPSTSTPTVTNVDDNPRNNECIQRNRNKEFIEIDLESNKVFIFNDDDGENVDSEEAVNNRFELNCDLNRNNDTNKAPLSTKEKVPFRSEIDITSNESRLTDEQQGKNYPPTIIKSTLKSKPNSLKISEQKIENNALRKDKNILQTVIQSPRNPYVRLERLNLITIQNVPSHSSSTDHSHHENDKSDANHGNLNTNISKQPEEADAEQENIDESSSTFTSTPLTLRTIRNCKCCSQCFDFTAAELDIHQDSCHLKAPGENIICVTCRLIFRSFDELNAHNHSCHFTSMLTPTPEKTKDHQAELANYLEMPSKNKIQSDFDLNIDCRVNSTNASPLSIINIGDHVYNTNFNPAFAGIDPVSNNYDVDIEVGVSEGQISNQTFDNVQNMSVFQEQCFTSESNLPDTSGTSNTTLYKCKFCGKKINSDVFQKHVGLCKNLTSNQEQEPTFLYNTNRIPSPTTTEVNLNCGDLVEVVKTEYVADGNLYKDTEFSNEGNNDNDPFEPESQMESFGVEETLSVLGAMQIPQTRLYCVSCKKQFNSSHAIKQHVRNYHETQGGKRRFPCPHPNCGKISNHKQNLQSHIQQVHSNARPFKCPYPNCTSAFKIAGSRNRHLKSHTNDNSEPM